MPSCTVVNKTGQSLNVCLKQVTALHFENTVKTDQEVKFKPGKVWFTLEAQVDDGTKSTRYSILKSAATIGLLSLAVGAVAATAGAALLPEAAVAGTVASASVAGSYLTKASLVTKGMLVKNAPTIAKVSSMAVPKAIERITAEIGGLSALQKEVLSIIASPTLSSDVRSKATHILRSLYSAYSKDKTGTPSTVPDPKSNPPIASASPGQGSFSPPTSSVHSHSEEEAALLEKELASSDASNHVETVPIQSGHILRVHGIYMDRRRKFEIRVNSKGELELWDAGKGEKWDRAKEKELDKMDKEERKKVEKEEKELKKREKEETKKAEKEKKEREKLKKEGRQSETDGESSDEESTSVMLDPEKDNEVKVLERRTTVKERLEALVHPPPPTTAVHNAETEAVPGESRT